MKREFQAPAGPEDNADLAFRVCIPLRPFSNAERFPKMNGRFRDPISPVKMKTIDVSKGRPLSRHPQMQQKSKQRTKTIMKPQSNPPTGLLPVSNLQISRPSDRKCAAANSVTTKGTLILTVLIMAASQSAPAQTLYSTGFETRRSPRAANWWARTGGLAFLFSVPARPSSLTRSPKAVCNRCKCGVWTWSMRQKSIHWQRWVPIASRLITMPRLGCQSCSSRRACGLMVR